MQPLLRPAALLPLIFLLVCQDATSAGDAGGPVTVMAFNVQYDARDFAASIDAIENYDPDILCVTELTPGFIKLFNKRLGARYRFRAFYPKQHGTWGVGLAAKYPLAKRTRFPLRPHRMPGAAAQVRLREQVLQVVCVHLFPPAARRNAADGVLTSWAKNSRLRWAQAKYLRERYAAWSGPVILMGDMNESRNGRAMSFLAANGYDFACVQARQAQCGPSYPGGASQWPAWFEIDHILGRRVRFTAAGVLRAGGSDHFPVYARLRLTTLGATQPGHRAAPASK